MPYYFHSIMNAALDINSEKINMLNWKQSPIENVVLNLTSIHINIRN